MRFEFDDRRLYKPQLARRFSCTTRTITNWWNAGKLPAQHRDEHDRPFNYASQIAEHEAKLGRRTGASGGDSRQPAETTGDCVSSGMQYSPVVGR